MIDNSLGQHTVTILNDRDQWWSTKLLKRNDNRPEPRFPGRKTDCLKCCHKKCCCSYKTKWLLGTQMISGSLIGSSSWSVGYRIAVKSLIGRTVQRPIPGRNVLNQTFVRIGIITPKWLKLSLLKGHFLGVLVPRLGVQPPKPMMFSCATLAEHTHTHTQECSTSKYAIVSQ